ncbi:hypothetical protein F441_18235 [Phytophthora nicotianae CJ01A1]|uniref:Mediator of RNA polymerase II transcription subunit 20 n=8 Tax=Phytophthora nicotianae TaxID=4792 RepID=W2YE18_PHYNI|nr:hypothetical protein L915_17866 [Phytophthora nicotianae]ETO64047.1 hypothetical protein F444_18378 [Phytophthora nicotianae P1976]ETP05116.1 hypothetical protein F441_18235 [Phytophthora nicotianae CJ01A1]ETP33275.1 hypothetical protein F442_18187 [Phytophthora nicotianae P10297]ETL28981.1 hypothetical protein L916_17766 [Phytophthora nicotianae]
MTGMTRCVQPLVRCDVRTNTCMLLLLLRVVIIQDVNITQKYQELLRKLETMGGEKLGRHVVHCRLFNRKTLMDGYVNQRMFMLRMSQNDDLVYAVLANEKAHGIAPSDNGIEGLMEDCSLLECGLDGANILQQVEIYAFKSDGQFEGTQYVVGDFVVSVCTFMSRNNLPRGLIIEVQYSPCYTVSHVDLLIDEFLSNFASHEHLRKPVDNMPALFEKVGLPNSEYSLKHTALQYVAAFNILRKFEK